MKVEDTIMAVPLIPNPLLIKRCLDYAEHKCKTQATVGTGTVNTHIRNVKSYDLNRVSSVTDKVLYTFLDKYISQHFINYNAKFTWCHPAKIVEASLLKYDVGGKYEFHCDSGAIHKRDLTCIINLNSDYEGGEFEFANPDKKGEVVKVIDAKNKMIFFPSNYLIPHRVRPITKGTRYSIVLWLI